MAPPPDCPARLDIDINPSAGAPTLSSGVTIEPLQVPTFPNPIVVPPHACYGANPDPATWDYSDIPAGACVFRLHGVLAECYPSGGTFFTGSCASIDGGGVKIAPGSFYDAHACGDVAPGCPSADPWTSGAGYWWYLVDRGRSVADLVICAPECAASFAENGGCLALRSTAVDCR
jgi:hypothetical protein